MNYRMMTVAALLVALPACAQKKKAVINDSNTPLHLLQPAYQGTYGDLTPEQVKKDIDRVFAYIDKETPARVVDKNTGKVITDYTAGGIGRNLNGELFVWQVMNGVALISV